jgi:hypothetical protein
MSSSSTRVGTDPPAAGRCTRRVGPAGSSPTARRWLRSSSTARIRMEVPRALLAAVLEAEEGERVLAMRAGLLDRIAFMATAHLRYYNRLINYGMQR